MGSWLVSHSRSKLKWKPDSDLSYNCLCSAGRAPSATAPTAEWGENTAIIHLCGWPTWAFSASVPTAQQTASFDEKDRHIGDAQESMPWSPHVDTLVSSQL